MLTLLTLACDTWHAPTTLNPNPLAHALPTPELDTAHLSRVRHALRALPPIGPRGFTAPLHAAPPDARAVAQSTLSPHAGATFSTRARGGYLATAGRHAVRYQLTRGARGRCVGTLRAFHGSPARNWWAIVHNGLHLQPGFAAENGRVYGDAVYLAKDFATAAAFSPHARVPSWSPLRVAGVTVVGEFRVHLGPGVAVGRCVDNCGAQGVWPAPAVPSEYVVVNDVSKADLVALHVLLARRRDASGSTDGANGQWRYERVLHGLQSCSSAKLLSLGLTVFILVALYLAWNGVL